MSEQQTGSAGGAGSSLRLDLTRDIHAPAIARSAVSEQMLALGVDGSFGQTVVLLVSEVVSNAVRHSNGPETLRSRSTRP